MAETIVLDPTAEATNRTQLDITAWVRAEGVEWGDAVFEAIAAQSERGDLIVDGRLPNRVVTIPLSLRAVASTSFQTIRSQIQHKVGLFQREGGWLMRQVGALPFYADVVNASLHLGGSWLQAYKDLDADAVLILECVPDWYGPELDLGDNVETTLPELVFTDTNVLGNYPGRVRVVVDEDQGQSQRGLLWGFRSGNYSSASTAALAYAGTALQTLDVAGTALGAVQHTNLSQNWTPVLGTNIGGTTYLTHQGSYRVWAAMAAGSAQVDAVTARFVWDVGDFTRPVENPSVTVPISEQSVALSSAGTFVLDLGEVRLDRAASGGTHRWQGAIQAKGVAGGEDLAIGRLWFQPLDDGGGYLRSPLAANRGLGAYTVRDDFSQTAGTLTGKAAGTGGNWVTSGATGGTADFNVSGAGVVTRVGESDTTPGRQAIVGSSMTNTVVQADVKTSGFVGGNSMFMGVAARGIGGGTALLGGITNEGTDLRAYMFLTTGGVRTLGIAVIGAVASDYYWTVRMYVDTDGLAAMWVAPQGAAFGDPVVVSRRTELATGGALAAGSAGLWDMNFNVGSPPTRTYDNFGAWVPEKDAVIFPSQSLELRTEGAFREDVGGTAYGPVSHAVGPLPRIPPSGLENRTVQMFLKLSRGDLDRLPDVAADDLSARPFYRPSYLFMGTA